MERDFAVAVGQVQIKDEEIEGELVKAGQTAFQRARLHEAEAPGLRCIEQHPEHELLFGVVFDVQDVEWLGFHDLTGSARADQQWP